MIADSNITPAVPTFDLCSFLYDSASIHGGKTFEYIHAGRRVIVVQTLKGANHVLRRNADNYRKELWSFQQVFGRTRLTEDGENWRRREKVTQPYLARFDARLLTAISARRAESLAGHLLNTASKGRLDQFSLDVATIRILADSLLCGRLSAEAENFAADLHIMLDYAASYAFSARNSKSNISLHKTGELANVRQRMMSRLDSIRRNLPDGDNLLTALDRADRCKDLNLRFHHELLLMFSAGSDTSAAALGWCCHALAENPEAQEAVRKEVRSVEVDELNDPGVLNRLPLLNGFVEETLRLYPPIPMLARHSVSSDEIDSLNVEPGDLIFVSIVGVHRDPGTWTDADVFSFSRASPESGRPARAIPFSAGPRVCGGARFATLELKALVANLLKYLSFEASGLEPGPFQWRISMRRQLGHPVKVSSIQ